MKLINEKLDYSKQWEFPHQYLFTGNATVRKDGGIVMGRGAARQCRDLFPGVDKQFGNLLQFFPSASILWQSVRPEQYLGWFKVKDNWYEKATLEIILASVLALDLIARGEEDENSTFHMNFPGIGNGGLPVEEVLPIIETLPDNVWVYK